MITGEKESNIKSVLQILHNSRRGVTIQFNKYNCTRYSQQAFLLQAQFRSVFLYSVMKNNLVEVIVRHGRLRGIVEENVLGGNFFAFRGIPYAKPPIGELRFQVSRGQGFYWEKNVFSYMVRAILNMTK